ncbi:aminotransferase-like domain-containing protein [Nicoliella lavandulae]|uniref:PLP-dependent aminotransferase family protein n=1 Tax=Nicoliella lavandulae TaxID=3082954 RepID=A0ABU8SND6_9LACO
MSINVFTDYPLSWRPDKRKLTRPYYKSLVAALKQAVASGELLPDTKLPPQRELADFLDIGFATVTRAYQLSQKLGITYGIVGRGTYIAKNVNGPQTITASAIKDTIELGFNASFESNNHMIQKTIQSVANQVQLTTLLNYDEPTGMAKHKLIASNYLSRIGMHANKETTMITSGGQNALTVVMLSLFNSGDKIAVDKFTYANFIELARMKGIELVPIDGDEFGMLPAKLVQQCQSKAIQGIYLMPDYANPTATLMPNERRVALAKVIAQYQLILIEDDYLNFLNLYRDHPLTKLSQLVPAQSIYICSMSKPLVSGLRVAFIRVADQFKLAVKNAIFNVNVKTSALDTEIITKALQNGSARKIMNSKIQMVVAANQIFNRVFGFTDHPHDYRFFRTIPVTNRVSGAKIEATLLNDGIHVIHSDKTLVGSATDDCFIRVSLTSLASGDELKRALIKLKAALVRHKFTLAV